MDRTTPIDFLRKVKNYTNIINQSLRHDGYLLVLSNTEDVNSHIHKTLILIDLEKGKSWYYEMMYEFNIEWAECFEETIEDWAECFEGLIEKIRKEVANG